MASTIPNGDYLSRFPYPNYDYQTPFYNYYGDHILPCSPSSNGPYSSICAGCNTAIVDSYIMKVLDRAWHSSCLKCCECQIQLTDKCYSKNGYLFCRNDFQRLNDKFISARQAPKCAGCDDIIYAKQVVRRAQNYVYHLNCFSCYMCTRQLNTGDEFYILEDRRVICKLDYDSVRSREVDMEVHQKRPRTSITSSQVDLLKTAYNRSSKPSRQTREQLAQDTGLDMRVVQVWFQNRRAKEKRLKKESRNKSAPYQTKREMSHKQAKQDSQPLCSLKSLSINFPSDQVACTGPDTPPMQSFEPIEPSTDECHTQSSHNLDHPQPLIDNLDLMRGYTHTEHDWHTPHYQKYETSFTSNYVTPSY